MKVSKLFFLAGLVAALAIPTSTIADISPADCTGGGIQLVLLRTPTSAHVGQQITYTIYVLVPNTIGQCDVDGITLRWLPPDQYPGGTFEDLIGGSSGNPPEDVLVGGTTTSFTRYYNVALADIQPNGNIYAYAEASGLVQDSGGAGSPSNDNDERPVLVVSTPDTSVGVSALPTPPVCAGTMVTLTITETNNNALYDSLTSPYVELLADGSPMGVSPLTKASSEFQGGDTNGNDVLDPGETWEWEVDVTPTATTLYTAIGHGTDPVSGDDVTWCEDPGTPPADTICDQGELAETTVTVVDAPKCSISGPGPVCEDSADLVYNGPASMTVYAWSIIAGDATIDGVANLQNVKVDAGSTSFTLQLYIEDGSGCKSTCTKDVTVNLNPGCSIIKPVTVPDCPSTGNTLEVVPSGGAGGYTYAWTLTGDTGWAITGGEDTAIVVYSAGPSGCATFEVEVTDSAGCKTTCELKLCCTGDTFCSFTQGFWGNAGGTKCDGQTTTDLLLIALGLDPEAVGVNADTVGPVPVVVGQGSSTLTLNTAQCILDLLPAGGTPAVIPVGTWTCSDLNGLTKPDKGQGKGNSKPSRLNNVLIGQVVALTLNLRVSDGCIGEDSGDLADWVLEAEFCTVPYDDPEACPKRFTIPASLVGKKVASYGVGDPGLLELANAALAGTGSLSISDIYTAVTAINEGFDECATIVDCGPGIEICLNGCDDDYDGTIDEIDCQVP